MDKYRKYVLFSIVIGIILAGVSLVRYKPIETSCSRGGDIQCGVSAIDGERGFPVVFPDPFASHYGVGINIFIMQVLGFSANALVYAVIALFLMIIYEIVLKK